MFVVILADQVDLTDTLAEHEAAGDPIPVVWAHKWDDAFSHIGTVTKAVETGDGLLITGRPDLDDNPTARQVHKLLKGRRVNQFSFSFASDVLDSGPGTVGGRDVPELRRFALHEVGPCLVGVNPATELRDAKAAGPDRTGPAGRGASRAAGHRPHGGHDRHLIFARQTHRPGPLIAQLPEAWRG